MNSIKYNIDTAVSPYYNYLSRAQHQHFFRIKNIEIRFDAFEPRIVDFWSLIMHGN